MFFVCAGFAFVSFEDPRDAEDAVAEYNGKSIRGQRVRVEISTRYVSVLLSKTWRSGA